MCVLFDVFDETKPRAVEYVRPCTTIIFLEIASAQDERLFSFFV